MEEIKLEEPNYSSKLNEGKKRFAHRFCPMDGYVPVSLPLFPGKRICPYCATNLPSSF